MLGTRKVAKPGSRRTKPYVQSAGRTNEYVNLARSVELGHPVRGPRNGAARSYTASRDGGVSNGCRPTHHGAHGRWGRKCHTKVRQGKRWPTSQSPTFCSSKMRSRAKGDARLDKSKTKAWLLVSLIEEHVVVVVALHCTASYAPTALQAQASVDSTDGVAEFPCMAHGWLGDART